MMTFMTIVMKTISVFTSVRKESSNNNNNSNYDDNNNKSSNYRTTSLMQVQMVPTLGDFPEERGLWRKGENSAYIRNLRRHQYIKCRCGSHKQEEGKVGGGGWLAGQL